MGVDMGVGIIFGSKSICDCSPPGGDYLVER